MPTDDGAWDQLLDEMDGVFTVTTEDGSVFGLDLDARLVCVAPEILTRERHSMPSPRRHGCSPWSYARSGRRW